VAFAWETTNCLSVWKFNADFSRKINAVWEVSDIRMRTAKPN
jgi:hypothetical protein